MLLLRKLLGLEMFLKVEIFSVHLTFTFPFFVVVVVACLIPSHSARLISSFLSLSFERQLYQDEVKQDVISLM